MPSLPVTHSTTRGYSVALLSALVLSTTAVFIRHLTEAYSLPPLVLAFWRDVFTAATLLPFLLFSSRIKLQLQRKDVIYMVLYGFVLAVFNTFWTLSVATNGAAVATVLVYSSTAFTAILGWRLLGEELSAVKLLVVFMALAGCSLVAGAGIAGSWPLNHYGLGIGLLSGLSYAAYSLMGRNAYQRGLNPWVTLFYTFGIAAVFLVLFNMLPASVLPGTAGSFGDYFWLGNSLSGWGALFALAAGPTVLGFGLYNISLGLLNSSVANLVVTSEPVFTAILAYLVLSERLLMNEILGGAIILAGVLLLRLWEGRSFMKRFLAPSHLGG